MCGEHLRELKGYSAATVYYTSAEIKAMAGNGPEASGTTAANSNPETGGEVPVVPAETEIPGAQAEAAEAGMPVWAIGSTALVVIRKKDPNKYESTLKLPGAPSGAPGSSIFSSIQNW